MGRGLQPGQVFQQRAGGVPEEKAGCDIDEGLLLQLQEILP